MSSSSSSSPTPTTTYPYSYTTFTNTAPSPFTTPSIVPSIFPLGPVPSCPPPSASSSSTPKAPFELPAARQGGCTISNDATVNDHAFWDMYACCKPSSITPVGKALPCSIMCAADATHSFLEIGDCLSKRVPLVVCSPPEAQRGEPQNSQSESRSSASASATGSKTESAAPSKTQTQTESKTASPVPPAATGAASSLVGGQTAVSKAGLMLFGLVAMTSVAGMLV